MADDFRPHLLITEDDVETIENITSIRETRSAEHKKIKGTMLFARQKSARKIITHWVKLAKGGIQSETGR